jgi:hypothetical protein
MSQMLTIFAPLLAFMLIPVWIPLVAVALGAVADLVSPRSARREPRPRPGRHRLALAETD